VGKTAKTGELVTRKTAGHMLCRSTRTVDRYIAQGILTTVRVGGSVWVHKESVERSRKTT